MLVLQLFILHCVQVPAANQLFTTLALPGTSNLGLRKIHTSQIVDSLGRSKQVNREGAGMGIVNVVTRSQQEIVAKSQLVKDFNSILSIKNIDSKKSGMLSVK